MEYLKEVLKSIGISEKRLKIGNCTAAEGEKFQREATEFDKEIKELGPNPLKTKKVKGGTPTKEKVKA